VEENMDLKMENKSLKAKVKKMEKVVYGSTQKEKPPPIKK